MLIFPVIFLELVLTPTSDPNMSLDQTDVPNESNSTLTFKTQFLLLENVQTIQHL